MRIEFSGHSDDIVSYKVTGTGEPHSDEIGAYNPNDHIHSKTIRVATIGGSQGVDIHALYDGTWSFAVSLLDEGRPLPSWSFAVDRAHEYSLRLTIDTGDDLVTVEAAEDE